MVNNEMASILSERLCTPSPHTASHTIVIPPTPTLSDSTGSDKSPVIFTPASCHPTDRHRWNEAEATLRGVPDNIDRTDSKQMPSIRSRRASDAGVFGRVDSNFEDGLTAIEPTTKLPTLALARPEVDEAIKGIPQGWEDDISIAIPATPVRPKPAPLPPVTGKTLRNIARLHSFRALPQKGNPLAAWRGRKVSNVPPVPLLSKQADGATVLVENLESIPAPARARLGLFTLPPAVDPSRQAGRRVNKLRRPAGDPYHNRSFSSSSSLTTPTVVTARTSHSSEDAFRSVIKVDAEAPAAAYEPETQETSDVERRDTVYTASTTSLPTSLVETPATENTRYAPSIASQDSSRSNRDRVLGLVSPANTTQQPKVYRQPELHEVLPFAAGRPFSAWDLGPGQTPPPRTRKPSLAGLGVERVQAEHGADLARRRSLPSRRSERQERVQNSITVTGPGKRSKPPRAEGWSKPSSGPLSKGRRDWLDKNGIKVAPHYLLGYEREVLDLEARLHETLQELAGGSHTFATFEADQEPATVLDIGTGTGAWPISQSLVWRNTRFVGIDAAPVQIDLQALAQAERIARSTSKGPAEGEGLWEGIAKRVSWDQMDISDTLPYDSGVFSLVHVRFLALGMTERNGAGLLEEIVRVLAPGGTLEIVEMGVTLPPSCPAPAKAAFAKALLHEMVNPDPSVPIKFNFLTVDGLVQSTFAKPVYERTWRLPSAESAPSRFVKGKEKEKEAEAPPAAIAEAGAIWMKTVLGYSKVAMGGTRSGSSLGLAGDDVNKKRNEPADARFLDALREGLGSKWDFGAAPEVKDKKEGREGKTAHGLDAENAMLSVQRPDVTELQLWAWVGKRKG